MKAGTVALSLVLVSSLTFARQSLGKIYNVSPETDTMRIVEQYGADSMVLSTSQQKMINGCWKELVYRKFDESGHLKLERTTRYASGKNTTCDFTPLIEYNRVYKKNALYQEFSRQAACDECETKPCGTEKRWSRSGKIVYQRNYSKCRF